jgi:hypothetical protein
MRAILEAEGGLEQAGTSQLRHTGVIISEAHSVTD